MLLEKDRLRSEQTRREEKEKDENLMPDNGQEHEDKSVEDRGIFEGNEDIRRQIEDVEVEEDLKKTADAVLPEKFRDLFRERRN